jgi:hypothetical protein
VERKSRRIAIRGLYVVGQRDQRNVRGVFGATHHNFGIAPHGNKHMINTAYCVSLSLASLLVAAMEAPWECTGCQPGMVLIPPTGAGRSITVTQHFSSSGECKPDCSTKVKCAHDIYVVATIPAGESMNDDQTDPCHAGPQNNVGLGWYSYNGDCGSAGTVNFYWHSGADCLGTYVDSARITLSCSICRP